MEQVVIKLSERDYHELLRCVRWVASDALNDANRRDAFALAARIEKATTKVHTPEETNSSGGGS
ncbi:MAG TPA: hypothetical protein VKU01_33805 [Bryobacteraceae bacterium]|nr:hypothetical protein [Bryobacteraceae bacterium]